MNENGLPGGHLTVIEKHLKAGHGAKPYSGQV
jgi:hypothetical protein